MRGIFILALLAVGVSAIQGTDDSKCTGVELIACAFLVDADKPSGDALAETEEALNARCKQSEPILKCLNDFSVRCPKGDLQHLKTFFQDEYDTLKRVCDKDGSLREKYLKNAKCMNKHRKRTEEKCGAMLNFEEAERLNKEHCVSYTRNFQCTFKDVENTCGKSALELETELLIPVTTLMDTICRDFQFSSFKYLPQIRRSYSYLH